MLTKPGIYLDVPMAEYIADPCPEPSLSTGVVCELSERSPAHARANHPRLSKVIDDSSSRSDLGSAAHAVLLGGMERMVLIDADSYHTKAAREARDSARDAGRIPILAHLADPLAEMSAAARCALSSFGDGETEQTIVWEDDGVWLRSRPDWVSADRLTVVDYKTANNADPATWIRSSLFSGGYDVQAALVLAGLGKLLGDAGRSFLFLVQEIERPYACSIVGAGPQLLDIATRKVNVARRVWKQCLSTNEWPGYDSRIHWAEAPPWVEYQWLERETAYEGEGDTI